MRIVTIAFACIPAVAFAHPGHGVPETSPLHLVSPEHLGGALLASLGVALLMLLRRRRRSAR